MTYIWSRISYILSKTFQLALMVIAIQQDVFCIFGLSRFVGLQARLLKHYNKTTRIFLFHFCLWRFRLLWYHMNVGLFCLVVHVEVQRS